MYLFLQLDPETQTNLLFARFVRERPYQSRRAKIHTLAEQQNHRCAYCGIEFIDPPPELIKYGQIKRWRRTLKHKRMATIEHIKPRGHGGESTWENEVAACRDCNTKRGSMDPIEFFENRLAIIAGRAEKRRQKRREKRRRKKR